MSKATEYYISEVQNIFRQNEHSHVSIVEELGAFFSDSFGHGLSHICLEKLKASLKQSVIDLSKEVDQMVEPVLVMHKMTSYVKNKDRGIISSPPSKKQKLSSSSLTSMPTRNDSIGPQSSGQGSGSDTVVPDENGGKGGNEKRCSTCSSTKTPQWRGGPNGPKTLCNACGIRFKKLKATLDAEDAEENTEPVIEDLLILLEDGGMQAKAALYKHNDELAKQMVEPVLVMHKMTSYLKNKERGIISPPPYMKQKLSSSSLTSTPTRNDSIGPQSSGQGSGSDTVVSDENGGKGGNEKRCSTCSSTKTPQWRGGPNGPKTLCNACGIRYKKMKAALDDEDAVENTEPVIDDLLILLEDGGMQAKAALYKHNDELAKQLDHMEQQLEELLDIVVSKCRQMNIAEKQQLRKLIQILSPKNLDRVVQIIKRRKLPKEQFYELNIDLEKEDNGTLWRLYYYVRAAENAKRLSLEEVQQAEVVL